MFSMYFPELSRLFHSREKKISAHLPGFGELQIPRHIKDTVRRTTCFRMEQDKPNTEGWKTNLENDPSLREVMRNAMSGRTLVDLAAGSHWEEMHDFAKFLGASRLIAVEKFTGGRFKGDLTIVDEIKDKECPGVLVKGDALKFISRVPNQSCCISINALDGSVIPTAEYHERLAEEVERVVMPGGVAFGTISHALSLIVTHPDLIEKDLSDPLRMSGFSLLLCTMPPTKLELDKWEIHSMMPFERVLIRK